MARPHISSSTGRQWSSNFRPSKPEEILSRRERARSIIRLHQQDSPIQVGGKKASHIQRGQSRPAAAFGRHKRGHFAVPRRPLTIQRLQYIPQKFFGGEGRNQNWY